MKSLNVKERRKAFISFFLLFLLTSSLVVTIVFFNFKVPEKENKYLHNKLIYLKLEEKNLTLFANEMEKVKSLIDSIGIKGTNVEFTEQLITTNLALMTNNYVKKDSSLHSKMYSNIISTYMDLEYAKLELLNLEDAKTDIEDYIKLVEELREDLDEKQRALDIYRHNGR